MDSSNDLFLKRILVIGGGGYEMRNIWPDASTYGIQVVLMDNNIDHLAKDQVFKFIHVDFADHNMDTAHAENIVSILQAEGINIDGCLAFQEDCGPLAATVCEKMGLNGIGYKAAGNVKKKSTTHRLLGELKAMSKYTSFTRTLCSLRDFDEIPADFTFPAVLKPEYGFNAFGATVVASLDEARLEFTKFTDAFKSDGDFPRVGLGFGNDMVLMEYIDGPEYDMDIIIFNRQLVAAFVTGNIRRENGVCLSQICGFTPADLAPDDCKEMVTAALQCCVAVGLTNGVFNVEFILTTSGPKLIEINGRMGGRYHRSWIRKVYNVDLMLCAMMISCGVCPRLPETFQTAQLVGINIFPSLHRHVMEEQSLVDRLEKDTLFLRFSEYVPDAVKGKEESFANVAVLGENLKGAKAKLLEIAKITKIDSVDFPVKQFLGLNEQM